MKEDNEIIFYDDDFRPPEVELSEFAKELQEYRRQLKIKVSNLKKEISAGKIFTANEIIAEQETFKKFCNYHDSYIERLNEITPIYGEDIITEDGEPIRLVHLDTPGYSDEKMYIFSSIPLLKEMSELLENAKTGFNIKSINLNMFNGNIEPTNVLKSFVKTPSHHYIPVDKATNILMNPKYQHEIFSPEGFEMMVSKRGNVPPVLTVFNFKNENNEIKTSGLDRMTEYDRQVSDAVLSLFIQADKDNIEPIFTTDMIYRAMPGCGEKASPQQKGAITKSLEKQQRLYVEIDATEALRKMKKIGLEDTFTIEGYYLLCDKGVYSINNGSKKIEGYRFYREPIIFEYAKKTGQFSTIPSKYMAIKEVKNDKITPIPVKMSPTRQVMTGYIIRQILEMKSDKRNNVAEPRSTKILFKTMFDAVDIPKSTKRQVLSRHRDFVFMLLDYETAAGFIKGYEKTFKGREITGINIIL